jgi:hypothetical protein
MDGDLKGGWGRDAYIVQMFQKYFLNIIIYYVQCYPLFIYNENSYKIAA